MRNQDNGNVEVRERSGKWVMGNGERLCPNKPLNFFIYFILLFPQSLSTPYSVPPYTYNNRLARFLSYFC